MGYVWGIEIMCGMGVRMLGLWVRVCDAEVGMGSGEGHGEWEMACIWG